MDLRVFFIWHLYKELANFSIPAVILVKSALLAEVLTTTPVLILKMALADKEPELKTLRVKYSYSAFLANRLTVTSVEDTVILELNTELEVLVLSGMYLSAVTVPSGAAEALLEIEQFVLVHDPVVKSSELVTKLVLDPSSNKP